MCVCVCACACACARVRRCKLAAINSNGKRDSCAKGHQREAIDRSAEEGFLKMATRMLNLIAKRGSALKITTRIPSSTFTFLVSPSYAAASRSGDLLPNYSMPKCANFFSFSLFFNAGHLFDQRPWRSEPIGSNSLFPAVLVAGALGIGSVGISLADAGEVWDCCFLFFIFKFDLN